MAPVVENIGRYSTRSRGIRKTTEWTSAGMRCGGKDAILNLLRRAKCQQFALRVNLASFTSSRLVRSMAGTAIPDDAIRLVFEQVR